LTFFEYLINMDQQFTLKNKTILITGASSGIGRATAILCSVLGSNLILTGRDELRLKQTFDLLEKGNHSIIPFDFEKNDNEEFVTKISIVDGIVHSAGIIEYIPFNYTTRKKLIQIFNVNFIVPFTITQNLLKLKKLSKNSSIVFLSSINGNTVGQIGSSAYGSSKGAISALVKVLALELASKKIRVNAICPGMVKTEMVTNSGITSEELLIDEKRNYPLGYGNPEDIANAICFFLSDSSRWITGTDFIIDGGVSIK
jgi:NAD(P)-dependent dehydrogenase (short-subunit alcohol dehydrogenase family)